MDGDAEAVVYLMMLGESLYSGAFPDACAVVWATRPVARRYARIETRDQTLRGCAAGEHAPRE
jgi:hypothetical protein